MYGAKTWITTQEMEQKLITTQRAMERKMLHLSLKDKVRHTSIRKKTRVKDIMEKIKESKWKWAGTCQEQQTIGGQKDSQKGNQGQEREGEDIKRDDGGTTSHYTWVLHGQELLSREQHGKS